LNEVAVVEARRLIPVAVRSTVELVATESVPVIAVELADAFLMVSPERSVSRVVEAPPRKIALAVAGVVSVPSAPIVVLAVAPKVETPSTPSVPPVRIVVPIVVEA
jgi:hypothetical protein